LAIEVKPGPLTHVPLKDRRKLLGYRRDLGYEFALFIAFRGATPDKPLLRWY
jgi:hypothetical protein